jgi:galactitol-specific phosphotransferase system IIC component
MFKKVDVKKLYKGVKWSSLKDIFDLVKTLLIAALMMLFLGSVIILPVYGWVNNIVELTKCDFEAPYKAEVIRVIGITIPPVGCVTGLMSIDDKKSD